MRDTFLGLAVVLALVSTACSAPLPSWGLVATDRSQVDADYAFQGEYTGTAVMPDGAKVDIGAQVIALGDGEFSVVVHVGGLPGAGWERGDRKEAIQGRRDGDRVAVTKDGQLHGYITAEGMTLTNPEIDVTVDFEKIERKSPTLGAEPPADAEVLFDGSGPGAFVDGRVNEAGFLWAGATTEPKWESYTLHLEFLLPYMPDARGQRRANSGVYLHDCYELQVLDSFGLEGETNECGGFYKVRVPDVNMCLPPLCWQTYDIDFTAPTYNDAGEKTAPARTTVRHNGVVIHEDVELQGTPGRQKEGPGPRPLHLQEHHNKVQYRNIWLVPR